MPTAYERLLLAGAPEIIEPMFYRIKFDDAANLDVQIRESHQYDGGSDLLVRREVNLAKWPADKVLTATVGAMIDAHEAVTRAALHVNLTGDHSGPDTVAAHRTQSEGWL